MIAVDDISTEKKNQFILIPPSSGDLLIFVNIFSACLKSVLLGTPRTSICWLFSDRIEVLFVKDGLSPPKFQLTKD